MLFKQIKQDIKDIRRSMCLLHGDVTKLIDEKVDKEDFIIYTKLILGRLDKLEKYLGIEYKEEKVEGYKKIKK